jgi:hypothetical protein
LCDLPADSGFGFSNTSLTKLESHILQIFAVAVSQNNALITMNAILEEKKDVKAWVSVISVVKQPHNCSTKRA